MVSQGRTTLIIAHRLSTVRQAHTIHLLEQGRIVESGTHDELLNRHGAYATLWRLQTGEALSQRAARRRDHSASPATPASIRA